MSLPRQHNLRLFDSDLVYLLVDEKDRFRTYYKNGVLQFWYQIDMSLDNPPLLQ